MLDNHATLTNPNAIGAVLSAPFPLADTARAAVAPLTIADGESGPCFYGEPEFVSSFCLRCGHARSCRPGAACGTLCANQDPNAAFCGDKRPLCHTLGIDGGDVSPRFYYRAPARYDQLATEVARLGRWADDAVADDECYDCNGHCRDGFQTPMKCPALTPIEPDCGV